MIHPDLGSIMLECDQAPHVKREQCLDCLLNNELVLQREEFGVSETKPPGNVHMCGDGGIKARAGENRDLSRAGPRGKAR